MTVVPFNISCNSEELAILIETKGKEYVRETMVHMVDDVLSNF